MELTYNLSDFTTSGGVVNSFILSQEITNQGFTVNGVAVHPPQCIIIIEGTLSAAEQTAIDGYVASHTGQSFSSTLQKSISEIEQSDDSGSEVVKASLSTGPMPSGTYLASYGMEIKLTSAGGGVTGVRSSLYVRKNGSSFVEKGQTNNGENQWVKFSESFATDVKDGDSFEFELRFRRIGTSGNAAMARFARLVWTRIGDI